MLSPTLRKRLELQGFTCSNDPAFVQIVPWLRFTPAVGMVMIALATWSASPAFLLALATMAALGVIFPVHPADLIYNYGLRYVTRTGPLPLNGRPRRFSFGVMALALIVTAILFTADFRLSGRVLGFSLVLIPATNVVMQHFCVMSLLYRVLFGDPKSDTPREMNMSRG